MCQANETEVMKENLQRMMRNENYFSSFFEKNQQEAEPANPFRKRMFDKKLRRSTVSCGHYNSTHIQSKGDESNGDSSRISMNALMKISENKQLHTPEEFSELPLQIEKTQKMKLTQSRQSNDPNKQRITQVINNFRLELDYLQQKLHAKVDTLNEKYHQQQYNSNSSQQNKNNKQREMEFMMESLEKIVGFMIENCVNLEDTVMYGQQQTVEHTTEQIQQQEQQAQHNHHRYNHRHNQPTTMKREIYQIYDNNQQQQQQKENISFGNIQATQHINLKVGGRRSNLMRERPIGEENNINMPNTFFINDKLHSNEKFKGNHINNNTKGHKQQAKFCREDVDKLTHRHPSKHHNRRISSTANQNDFHYFSGKDSNRNSSCNNNNYSSCGIQSQHIPVKSIYQTVLQQREIRMKMKKKII